MTGPTRSDILVCTKAVGSLSPGGHYHFLSSPSRSNCAYLVQYVLGSRPRRKSKNKGPPKRKPEPAVILHVVSKEDFENGLCNGVLKIHQKGPRLPPWMEGQTEGDLIELGDRRKNFVVHHQDRIDSRVSVVYEAAERIDDILQLQDPLAAISNLARQHDPVQNVTRFRCWLFTYLLFGSKGLHYSTSAIGRWCRKRAAENKNPKTQSVITAERLQKMLDAYHKHKKLKLRKAIYAAVIRLSFGCKTQESALGRRLVYHPQGDWFPTERVFFYHVDQHLNPDDRKKNRLGAKRYHGHEAPSMGSFTELVGNAHERVEYDPFHSVAHPSGLSGAPMPKLIIGRLRDSASGAIVGISFDMGGETVQAYLAAQFCAAIDKQHFCRLFGVDIKPGEWPCIGVSLKILMDRGPASTVLRKAGIDVDDTIELAPSGKGQAKAVIESSHPRTLKNEEGPGYSQSSLSVFQMVKAEILRVLRDNETFDVVDRIPPSWMSVMDRGTPMCLYSEFARRGRSDAVTMSFDSAVRKYLPLIEIEATRDGLSLAGQPFINRALQETDFFRRIPKGRTLTFKAHYLRACVHYIWLDYQGKIFELEISFKINNGKDASYLTLDELIQISDKKRTLTRELQTHALGINIELDERAEKITGQPLGAMVRRAGRVKKNQNSAREGRLSVAALRGKM